MGCVGTRAQALGVSQRLHVLDHSGSTSSSPAGWFHQLWQLPGGQLSVVPWGWGGQVCGGLTRISQLPPELSRQGHEVTSPSLKGMLNSNESTHVEGH